MNPRVLLTTRSYRLVYNGAAWTSIERGDGKDLMGQRRWRLLTDAEKASELARIVDQIGDALLLRARRRRKGAK